MLTKLYVQLRNWHEVDEGATATEYAVLVGFLAIALIVGAAALAAGLNGYFGDLGGAIAEWDIGS